MSKDNFNEIDLSGGVGMIGIDEAGEQVEYTKVDFDERGFTIEETLSYREFLVGVLSVTSNLDKEVDTDFILDLLNIDISKMM